MARGLSLVGGVGLVLVGCHGGLSSVRYLLLGSSLLFMWRCGASITLLSCMVVLPSIFSIGHGPPLSYLHGKKMTPVRIMNSVALYSKKNMNNVSF